MATTITTLMSLLNQFSLVFTDPTFQVFVPMMTGWILCTGRRTTTGLIPFADPQRKRPHDAFHRNYPDARWATSELWRLLALLLVTVFYPTGTILLYLDDTVFHRNGRKIHGASWHRDAVRSTGTKIVYAWRLKLVILTIGAKAPWGGEPLRLPINMRLFRKGQSNLIDLAEEMLREVDQWLPPKEVYRLRRRVLCYTGWSSYSANGDHQPHTMRCKDFCSAFQKTPSTREAPIPKRDVAWPTHKKWPYCNIDARNICCRFLLLYYC